MSDPDQSGISRRTVTPTLRLFLGSAADELRAVPVELGMLTIGRRPYNDLPLDDLTVSGEHAMLRRRNGEFVIYDLNSRNGTLVNGLPVQHRVLADGDVIDIGIYRLRFEESASASSDVPISGPDPAPPEPESPAAHRESPLVESRSGSSAAEPDSPSGEARENDPQAESAAAAAASDEPQASIEHMNGPQVGHRQTLERTINRVGGAAEQVAVISRRKGGFYITHLEGLTFPQVNGELIGLSAHRLCDGDLIELAGAMLRFRLEP